MRRRNLLIPAVLAAVAAPLIWVRFAPSDVATWHVDPMQVARPPVPPREGGWLVRTGTANAPPPVFDTDPATLLSIFDDIVLGEPNTTVLAESPSDGLITYVSRTPLIGCPDYISVKAVPEAGGAALMIWGRNRFGTGDMGTNRDRIEYWMKELSLRLPPR